MLTKDAYVPLTKRFFRREPSDRAQLRFGKTSVAVMGVVAIWIALNMGKFGGAFDVYLRADSLYKPSMFVPVMLGLIYTRTPWWSGMMAFGAGVVAILIVGGFANVANGIPLESIGSIFEPIKVTVLGIEMGRYELNTLVGIGTSALVFFISAFFTKREGAFAERVESLERDLATPAYATPGDVDLRGFRAYYFAGRLSVVVGGLLVLLAIPAEDGALNAVAGLVAIGLGVLVVMLTRRAARAAGPPADPSNDRGRSPTP